jgi:hypothetical protein
VASGPLFHTDSQGRPLGHEPRRHATQAAGQAIHLSQTFFGRSFQPPLTW